MLQIEVIEGEDHAVCRPLGELDAFTVGRLRERLGELSRQQRLVIDLSEVPFIDSAGLGALIGTIRANRDNGGQVAVACSRPNLQRLLHTAGFDRLVAVRDHVEDALLALDE